MQGKGHRFKQAHRGEGVAGIGNEHACLSDGPIPNSHTLYEPRRAHLHWSPPLSAKITAKRPEPSSPSRKHLKSLKTHTHFHNHSPQIMDEQWKDKKKQKWTLDLPFGARERKRSAPWGRDAGRRKMDERRRRVRLKRSTEHPWNLLFKKKRIFILILFITEFF